MRSDLNMDYGKVVKRTPKFGAFLKLVFIIAIMQHFSLCNKCMKDISYVFVHEGSLFCIS